MGKKKDLVQLAIQTVLSKLESTEKFALDQAPEVCRQLVQEEKVTETMNAITGGILTLVFLTSSLYFYVKANQPTEHPYEDYGGYAMACCVLLFCVSIASAIVLYRGVQELIRLKVAPKVFLIRKFRNML